ncbi:meteorin-like [Conger conger]|uniref:meteorin-like n=1 Tax=Conger conger TaxID=82655 RepID=UPI002A59F67C|nr:meteorin-like [Conger conger]
MLHYQLYIVWVLFVLIFDSAFSSYSEDQCSWKGSGLSQPPGSVEQISLHCAEGSLDWLYPQGALRLTLSPRLLGPGGRVTACVRPAEGFGGAQLYVERDGALELLAGDRADPGRPPAVRCASRRRDERVTLFLQATPHRDISRRIAAFRYELQVDWPPASDPVSGEGACRPCNDTEILTAVCTNDFVVRGSIRSVRDERDLQTSVVRVAAARVFRQKRAVFSAAGGEVRTPLRCGVRPGGGSFLFTGRVRFGEAWLGCAPRYRDFRRAYELARGAGRLPCELPSD